MLTINGFSSRFVQVVLEGVNCFLQFRGIFSMVQGKLRPVFLAIERPSTVHESVSGGGSADAEASLLSDVARVFIGEAESHLMACHRQQITAPQCAARLEKTLQDIVSFARRLEKSRSHKDCDRAGLDRLMGDIESARQSVLRLLRWIENDGLSDRVLPPCGGRGSHAHFAMREADGSLRWIGLLNWSFDGIAVEGFAHAESRPVRLAATDIVDWQHRIIGAQGSDH